MTGTDERPTEVAGVGPAVVLVKPQLGENIGMVARAMLNCCLLDLRLVQPREAWPNGRAYAAASGADRVLDRARVFASTADAIADLHHVYAATARARDMSKPTLTPRGAATEIRSRIAHGVGCGVLFGREATGLDNDDVARANAIVTVPLNPEFRSLNLAMAVLLIGYEWMQTGSEAAAPAHTRSRRANNAEMSALFAHLEGELDRCGFLRNLEKRPVMVRNIRNLFNRAELTEQEVRTLRGVITCLVTRRAGRE